MVHVTAAIWIKDETVFIARRRPGLRHAGKWEFPGGKLQPGESHEACLAREMMEEFDIAVDVGPRFADTVADGQRGPVHIHLYPIRWRSGKLVLTDHDRCTWVIPEQLLDFDLLEADRVLAEKLIAAPHRCLENWR
jgi:8-oxo-dGTP diphosphatase